MAQVKEQQEKGRPEQRHHGKGQPPSARNSEKKRTADRIKEEASTKLRRKPIPGKRGFWGARMF